MSYKVTVYTHLVDEGLRWVLVEADQSYTADPNYATSAGDKYNVTGPCSFRASVDNGYVFSQWVYRLGSTTAAVQYSDENPFVYDGSQDIYIRPEIAEDSGGSAFADWTSPSGKTMDNIETKQSVSVNLDPYELYQFTIRTKYSGTLTAYTTGDLDTVGYLTTGLLWDDEEGVPYNIKAENDDGEDSNFELTYEVTAGTTYHLWVRCYDPENEGRVTVVVEPPGAPQAGVSGKMHLYIKGEGWVQCTPYIYTGGEWKECTPNLYTGNDWEQGT